MLAVIYVVLVGAMILGTPAYMYFGSAMDCFYCAEEMKPIALMTIAIILWLVTSATSVRILVANIVFGENINKVVLCIAGIQTITNILMADAVVTWLLSFNV